MRGYTLALRTTSFVSWHGFKEPTLRKSRSSAHQLQRKPIVLLNQRLHLHGRQSPFTHDHAPIDQGVVRLRVGAEQQSARWVVLSPVRASTSAL